MKSSAVRLNASAVHLVVTTSLLRVQLADGREISAPLDWFPKLREASRRELDDWQIVGQGVGIHFPQVDEDIPVERLLAIR